MLMFHSYVNVLPEGKIWPVLWVNIKSIPTFQEVATETDSDRDSASCGVLRETVDLLSNSLGIEGTCQLHKVEIFLGKT